MVGRKFLKKIFDPPPLNTRKKEKNGLLLLFTICRNTKYIMYNFYIKRFNINRKYITYSICDGWVFANDDAHLN